MKGSLLGAEVSCTGFELHTDEWHAGGWLSWAHQLLIINYCIRGMWKISQYGQKEEAVEAAIFTFPRPVASWHKASLPLCLPRKVFPQWWVFKFPLISQILSGLSAHLISSLHIHPNLQHFGRLQCHRCPAMAPWFVPYREPRAPFQTPHSLFQNCITQKEWEGLWGYSFCYWHETCHFAFQFLSFPDRRMERTFMRAPLQDQWAPSEHILKTAPFNSVPLQEWTKPAFSLLSPVTFSLRQQEKVGLKILILF